MLGFIPKDKGNSPSPSKIILCRFSLLVFFPLFSPPPRSLFSFHISILFDRVKKCFFAKYCYQSCIWKCTIWNNKVKNGLFVYTGGRDPSSGVCVHPFFLLSHWGNKKESSTSALSQSFLSSGFPRIAKCCHWFSNCQGEKHCGDCGINAASWKHQPKCMLIMSHDWVLGLFHSCNSSAVENQKVLFSWVVSAGVGQSLGFRTEFM